MDDSADRAALRSVGFENSVTPLKRAGKACSQLISAQHQLTCILAAYCRGRMWLASWRISPSSSVAFRFTGCVHDSSWIKDINA